MPGRRFGRRRAPRAWVALVSGLFVVALAAGVSGAAPPEPGTYRQPLSFEWDTTSLDVLIVPPAHGQVLNGNGILNGFQMSELNPQANTYMAAILESIGDWRQAVDQFGSASLKGRLVINDYVMGSESVPPEALAEPEIVVMTDETKGPILGAAISSRVTPCVVDASKLFVTSFTYNDMYSVGAHEFGHCLGLDHVGRPNTDLMYATYPFAPGDTGNPKQCISNLNVAGLELVFDGQAGGEASISEGQYQTITC
jgi:hypothetical protein